MKRDWYAARQYCFPKQDSMFDIGWRGAPQQPRLRSFRAAARLLGGANGTHLFLAHGLHYAAV
jgi:hypothetical protein